MAICILIAGDSVGGGHGRDFFGADKVWLFVTILAVGYMISRGLAKAGAREPYSIGGSHDGGITDRLTKAATVLREGDLPGGGNAGGGAIGREPDAPIGR